MPAWVYSLVIFVFSLFGILFATIMISHVVDRIGLTAIRVVDHYWTRRQQYVEWITKVDPKHGFDSIQ